MAREVSLPLVFARYAGQVHFVQQVSDTEFSSSCPSCGGDLHPGGEWPDRCRWFDDGHPRGWCRRENKLFWPDDGAKPDPLALEAWRKEQVQREEARKRSAERALELLRESAFWEQLHEEMGAAGRAYWRKSGLSDGWQNFWQLGWATDRAFGGVTCDAASIPIFGPDWQIRQVKFRLMDESKGRYRSEPSGLGASPFLCDPSADYSGHVIAVEGEKKAAVTFARLGDGKRVIIGLPGTNLSQPTLDLLQPADRITLVVDPGAKRAGIRMAQTLGVKRCRLLETQVKIDDFLVANNTTKHELEWLLRGATVLSAFVGAK